MNRSTRSRNLSVIVAANFALITWHLYALGKLHPSMTASELARVGGAFLLVSLAGLVILWTRLRKAAGALFLLFFTIGFVIGGYEHFLKPGPDNVVTMLTGPWVLLFQVSAILLLLVEPVGIWACARLLRSES